MPQISQDFIPQRLVDLDLRHPQMVEQLVEVPTVLSLSLLQQRIAGQIVDNPVPRGRRGSGVFKVFSQNRTQQHFSPISKKSAEVARSPSARVHAHSSSSTPAAYVEPMESSEWVQLSDDATSRTYFWNRRTRLSSWHQGRLGRNSGMRRGSSTTGTRLLTRVSVYDLPPLPPSWWASQ